MQNYAKLQLEYKTALEITYSRQIKGRMQVEGKMLEYIQKQSKLLVRKKVRTFQIIKELQLHKKLLNDKDTLTSAHAA